MKAKSREEIVDKPGPGVDGQVFDDCCQGLARPAQKIFHSSTVSGCLKLENCLFPPYFLPDKGSPPLELDSQLHPHRILSEMILLSTNILAAIAQIEYLQTLS